MRIICTFVLVVSLFFICLNTNAQLNLRLPNGVRPAVEKVLTAYTENFKTIQGDTLSVTSNTAVFTSIVKPEGAVECTLTKYLNGSIPDYSWQATMFKSDDFAAASKKYTTCYQQLKNMMLRTTAGNFKMDGDYQQPNETKNFYSCVFTPDTDDPAVSRLRLEILLEGDMTEWTLSILVYDQVHDDKEGSMSQ